MFLDVFQDFFSHAENGCDLLFCGNSKFKHKNLRV